MIIRDITRLIVLLSLKGRRLRSEKSIRSLFLNQNKTMNKALENKNIRREAGWQRMATGTAFFLLTGILCSSSVTVHAAAGDRELPTLVQTVSDLDVYEGMAALGMLRTQPAEHEDMQEAYEKVRESIVRIDMPGAYGSGIVFRLEPERIVIATNGHVLDYWQDDTGIVCFEQGEMAHACLLGRSQEYDVGFLEIPVGELDAELLQTVREINDPLRGYEWEYLPQKREYLLQPGQSVFYVGAGGQGEQLCYEGILEDLAFYIPVFGENMLYGSGYICEGMSGGGTFDRRGYFLGMISGGTDRNETASIPAKDICEAYEKLTAQQKP
jgi:hypothetical protein